MLSVLETTLGANQPQEEMERLQWKSIKNETSVVDDGIQKLSDDKVIINLKPMEIRTFLVKLSPGKKV